MEHTFNVSKFRTIKATFGETIKMHVMDSRVPDNDFEGEFSLLTYNEIVEFFKEHEHIFAMNTAKERFKR